MRGRDEDSLRFRAVTGADADRGRGADHRPGSQGMIDPSRTPVPAPVDGSKTSGEAPNRDEQSMRFVEWVLALAAIGAAVLLALR
jgi:hypothetical protein